DPEGCGDESPSADKLGDPRRSRAASRYLSRPFRRLIDRGSVGYAVNSRVCLLTTGPRYEGRDCQCTVSYQQRADDCLSKIPNRPEMRLFIRASRRTYSRLRKARLVWPRLWGCQKSRGLIGSLGPMERGDRTIMDIPEHRHVDSERQHIDHLYRFTDRLWGAKTANDLSQATLEAITCTLACSRASILLLDDTGHMRCASQRGMSDAYRCTAECRSPWPRDVKDP